MAQVVINYHIFIIAVCQRSFNTSTRRRVSISEYRLEVDWKSAFLKWGLSQFDPKFQVEEEVPHLGIGKPDASNFHTV